MKKQFMTLGIAVLVVALLVGGGASAKAMGLEAGWYGSSGFNLGAYTGMGKNLEVGASVNTVFVTLGVGAEGRYLLKPVNLEFLGRPLQPYALGRVELAGIAGGAAAVTINGGVGVRYPLTEKFSLWESVAIGPTIYKDWWGQVGTSFGFNWGGGFRFDF